MTYEQALAFWFGRINYERQPLRPGELKLDRMRELLAELGNPQESLRIVHIAGSKGKGSTAAMLASVAAKAHYRVGLFTSPHLSSAEERFQINGKPIVPEHLTACMSEVARAEQSRVARRDSWQDACPTQDAGVTFFEIAAALALVHFRNEKVDLAVLEVGLGGRFDATNLCLPLLAIITNISYDHTQQLGHTLAEIAREKAGIVKRHTPTVCGARSKEARKVIEDICRRRKSKLRRLGSELSVNYQPGRITAGGGSKSHVQIATDERVWPFMELGLLGEHQADNAALVVAAVEELRRRGYGLPDESVAAGLAEVDWPARLEVVARRPLVILDCAHNRASAEALVRALQTSIDEPLVERNSFRFGENADRLERHEFRSTRRRKLIFAASRDKDVPGMLAVLAPHFNDIYLTCFRNNPRRVPAERLAQMLGKVSSRAGHVLPDAKQAWQRARASAREDDLICITGSVFLAGELRPVLL